MCGGPAENDFPKQDDGKAEARGTTDRCCCMILCACTTLMVAMVGLSVYYGQPYRLTRGYDYKGRLCGIDAGVENAPYVFYCGSKERQKENPSLPQQLSFHSKACVSACPENITVKVPCLRKAFPEFSELPGNVSMNGVHYYRTYEMDIMQTVQLGSAYPSYPMGKYCLPQDTYLRDSLLYGPLNNNDAVATAAGSFKHAFPVIILSAVLASLLGFVYLQALRRYAGLLIFASLVITTVVLFIIGFFFLIAIFFPSADGESNEGSYERLNPIMHTFWGIDGKIYSILIGLVVIGLSVCLAQSTRTAMPNIDKSVGIVWAACDCIFNSNSYELIMEAFFKSLFIILQLVICMAGLMLLTSVGYIDNTNIRVNDQDIPGLESHFEWFWWQRFAIAFYLFMCWWLFEISIARYQFAVTYGVCQWYFVPSTSRTVESSRAAPNHFGKQVSVRVSGVDAAHTERQGVKVKSQGGEVLVVPVGTAGPGHTDVLKMVPQGIEFGPQTVEQKNWPKKACMKGNEVGIRYHLGSLALGAIEVPITRIPRLIATAIRALLGRSDKRSGFDEEDQAGSFKAVFDMIAGVIEGTYSGMSKNAYAAIVLGGVFGFSEAANRAKGHIEDAGGAVAFMHGTCGLYELIGTIGIVGVCTAFTNIFLSNGWACLGDVQDTWSMTMASCIVSGVIAYAFMSLFNITIDTILYTFVFARKQGVKNNDKLCPHTLRDMLKADMKGDHDNSGQLEAFGGRGNPYRNSQAISSVFKMTKTALGTTVESSPLLSTNLYATSP
mmetsp:Transcript_55582/g.154849  ORF Transcript_55582/g.154849 Transcript_55582/m.154849 type:complete len:779 (-) Transcript_55582:111-2447(-)